MPATKYKQYYQQMIDANTQVFSEFLKIHDLFAADKAKWGTEFNRQGKTVLDIIRDWDRRLCSAMGRGQFSAYSQKLSEKFWSEVRKEFALIDLVGVTIRQVSPPK